MKKLILPLLAMILLVSFNLEARGPARRAKASASIAAAAQKARQLRAERQKRQNASRRGHTAGSAVARPITYLNTQSFSSDEQSQLLAAATGDLTLTADQTAQLLRSYEESPAFQQIEQAYSQDLYELLRINPAKPDEWRKKNPKWALGILNYVGDSGEGEADVSVSWQTINTKLRAKADFTDEEALFYAPIAEMVETLPQVKGLVFRGQAMTKERYNAIEVGTSWHQLAFTSTSLSPTTAGAFGAAQEPRKTAILILKVKNGAPVSVLTFDNGFQGQPGRTGEREVLLADGESLFVNAKIEDTVNNRYYIFAEQE